MTLEELKKQKIEYIGFDYENPKECLKAVKQDGTALRYVKEQTEQICLEAVKQNWRALQFVKEQTPEICLEAVKQNAEALKYVEDLSMLV